MTAEFQLSISHELAERIRQHGIETFPHECCGALLGRDVAFADVAFADASSQKDEPAREVRELFPLINRRDDSPRNRFAVTAEDVLAAEKDAPDISWSAPENVGETVPYPLPVTDSDEPAELFRMLYAWRVTLARFFGRRFFWIIPESNADVGFRFAHWLVKTSLIR